MAVIVLILVALLVLVIGMTVRSRRRIEQMHQRPQDMRRAGESDKPPFNGRGGAI